MRILVTGGAGFIGSALIRQLVRNGKDEILNLDKLTYAANLDNLKLVAEDPRYHFVRGDVAHHEDVAMAIDSLQPDAVVHLAAESHVDRSIDGPAAFIATNLVGTYSLLEATRNYWQRLSSQRKDGFRFIHVSTDEVYGSLGPSGLFNEQSRYAPNSPYSASKAGSDMLARAWHKTYGLPVIVTNCSNNFGPYQFPEKFVPVIILSALEGRPIPVYGIGNNVRDWLFVEDHADALIKTLQSGAPGETYCIGASNEISNLDMATRLCRILDEVLPLSPRRPHEQLIEFVPDRPGHDFRYAIDSSKSQRELGWAPRHSIADGLRQTVEWYLANRWWWQAIRNRGFEQGRLGLSAIAAGGR